MEFLNETLGTISTTDVNVIIAVSLLLIAAMPIAILITAVRYAPLVVGILRDTREDWVKSQQSLAESQSAIAVSLKTLSENALRTVELEAEQNEKLDALRKGQQENTQRMIDVTESLKPEMKRIQDAVGDLPDKMQEQLKPVVEGIESLSKLVEDTAAYQREQIDNLMESHKAQVKSLADQNEKHMENLTNNVKLVQGTFTEIVKVMVKKDAA